MEKIGGEKSKGTGAPFIFWVINKSYEYGFDYDMMKRLNYNDLLYILVNKEIEKIKEHFKNKEYNRNEANGYTVTAASNNQINNMHK